LFAILPILGENIGVFVNPPMLGSKLAVVREKNANFSAQIFGENIF
jgi:hypothetical protein